MRKQRHWKTNNTTKETLDYHKALNEDLNKLSLNELKKIPEHITGKLRHNKNFTRAIEEKMKFFTDPENQNYTTNNRHKYEKIQTIYNMLKNNDESHPTIKKQTNLDTTTRPVSVETNNDKETQITNRMKEFLDNPSLGFNYVLYGNKDLPLGPRDPQYDRTKIDNDTLTKLLNDNKAILKYIPLGHVTIVGEKIDRTIFESFNNITSLDLSLSTPQQDKGILSFPNVKMLKVDIHSIPPGISMRIHSVNTLNIGGSLGNIGKDKNGNPINRDCNKNEISRLLDIFDLNNNPHICNKRANGNLNIIRTGVSSDMIKQKVKEIYKISELNTDVIKAVENVQKNPHIKQLWEETGLWGDYKVSLTDLHALQADLVTKSKIERDNTDAINSKTPKSFSVNKNRSLFDETFTSDNRQ